MPGANRTKTGSDFASTYYIATWMQITLFPSDKDPQGQRVECTYEELLAFFRDPQPKDVAKGDLEMWSPATFRDDRRAAANVEGVCALVYDVDISPVPDAGVLRGLGIKGFAHSSSSSLASSPRWRLVLLLDRVVTADEYRRLQAYVAERLPFDVGPQAKDASRAWYCPRAGEDGSYALVEIS